MSTTWKARWRGLDLEVRGRTDTPESTATLRILQSNEPRVEVECFGSNPHWRADPGGLDQVEPLDERHDPVSEAFARIRSDLPARAASECEGWKPLEPATPEDEKALLEAERIMRHCPVRLEELDPVVLRGRRSEKWHTYPADVLPLWVAEMDFPVAAPIRDEMRRFLRACDFGYPLGVRETGLPDVFAQRMQERFGWHPDPGGVEVVSEVVQGLHVAVEAYSAPGEGVIVQTPIYPPFLGTVRDTGRRLVENRMEVGSGRLEFDLEGMSRSITADTRVLLFCNPHNPSGRALRRGALERIAELVLAHDLIVVSDEIHADLVLEGERHLPFAALSEAIARRTVTLTSASKAFNIPGLRTAIAHFGDPALRDRFNAAVPRHARGGIGLLGLYATISAWRFGQPWLEEVVLQLRRNVDVLEQAISERIPEIRVMRPEATYLAWLDCRRLDLDGAPAAHFLRHGRVALSEGSLFGPGWEGFARINLATSPAILLEAVERMARALGR